MFCDNGSERMVLASADASAWALAVAEILGVPAVVLVEPPGCFDDAKWKNAKPSEPHTMSSAASTKIGERKRFRSGCWTDVAGVGRAVVSADCCDVGKMPVTYRPGCPATGILTIRAGPVSL